MKLRVGLIGLGDAWEPRHRPALRALADRFEVRAVCEQVRRRAELAAAEFHAEPVDSFRALARREDVDAVLILSSQWYGWLPILAACEAGKAVYYGGGFNPEPEQARRIQRRVEEAGIAFMAEFPRRHWAATLRLKELIATKLGAPRLLFCHHRLTAPERSGQSATVRSRPPIMQELVELVDWCRYVVGKEPTFATGMMHRSGDESAEEDYQMMSLDFSDPAAPGTGPLAQISCGRYFPARWREAIQEMLTSGAKGLVVDLRNNPGGLLDSAIEVAGEWVDGRPVVIERIQGVDQPMSGSGRARLADLPTVVLVNGGSASASEIVAGALKDYDLATIVGETTFGKGSVQDYQELSDGSSVKLTIAEWLTPNGNSIHETGIEPDVAVEFSLEDLENGLDPQMDAALQIINGTYDFSPETQNDPASS